MIDIREIEEGDKILFNDRAWPATADTDAYLAEEKVGSIMVIWRVEMTGPRGADMTLEKTSTGRIRCSPSQGAPHENVNRLIKL